MYTIITIITVSGFCSSWEHHSVQGSGYHTQIFSCSNKTSLKGNGQTIMVKPCLTWPQVWRQEFWTWL